VTNADKVRERLHKSKIDDMSAHGETIRADGLVEHVAYNMQVENLFGAEVSLGLLSRRGEDVGRTGIRYACGIDLLAGQDIVGPYGLSSSIHRRPASLDEFCFSQLGQD
jgi:hypothetical protein